MIDTYGRKLMNGDVIEVPNLKDYYPLDSAIARAIPKYYVIQDASYASEGFSQTWLPHLWRVKATPLVNAQEETPEVIAKRMREGALIPKAGSAPNIGEPPKPGPGVKVASLSPFLPATQGSARKADYAMESANSPAPAVKAVDVMKLIKFQGDKLGTKSHFDALSPTARDKFTEMIAAYNKPVQVNSAMRDPVEQQKLWDAATPDPNNPNKRLNAYGNPVAPPGNSRHESGKALDLNTSDVEALDAGGFLKTFGFKRLADDPPHIEMARLGGVFNGPESGYPVMLHGTEAVLPSVQLEEVKSMMGSVSKTSLGSELPSITNNTSTNNDDTLNALRDLYDVMSDKLDNVIDKLASGNDIQDKLLRNSMV
jgi:hypothetical protein